MGDSCCGLTEYTSLHVNLYSAPTEERSIAISVSVCLCVCVCLYVRDHIFGPTRPIFTKFLAHVTSAVAPPLAA